jgi:hypothetical protein
MSVLIEKKRITFHTQRLKKGQSLQNGHHRKQDQKTRLCKLVTFYPCFF